VVVSPSHVKLLIIIYHGLHQSNASESSVVCIYGVCVQYTCPQFVIFYRLDTQYRSFKDNLNHCMYCGHACSWLRYKQSIEVLGAQLHQGTSMNILSGFQCRLGWWCM